MADKQRGQRGQNQNQDMNRSSGSNAGNRGNQQNQQTQNTGAQRGSQQGMGKVGNTAPDNSRSSGNRNSR
jgi:transcription termination factor Rho